MNRPSWPTIRLVAVALAVVLAGCGSAPSGAESPTSAPPDTATPSPSATATPTATERPVQNPWGKAEVTVAVSVDDSARSAPYHSLLETAVARMNDDIVPSLSEEITFVAVDRAASADIVMELRPTIQECGTDTSEDTFIWCSDSFGGADTIQDTVRLQVTTRYTDAGVTQHLTEALTRTLVDGDLRRTAGLNYSDTVAYPLADPWPGKNDLTVAIESEVPSERDYRPLVTEALRYWEEVDGEYGEYEATFEVVPDPADADIVVSFTTEITQCGVETSELTLGCASLLGTSSAALSPERVDIETGYTDESTIRVLKHEFGHLYGLEHGQSPKPLMNAEFDATRLPQQDAVEKENPWERDTLRVYTDYDSFDAPESDVREQVTQTLAYYEGGAEGNAPDIEFVTAANESTADIVIRGYSEMDAPCDLDSGSCIEIYGESTDADDALEYYSLQRIQLIELPTDRIGWHIGYQLAAAFPAYDVPPPFDEPDSDDRSDWWK